MSQLAEPVYVNRFVLGGKQNERVLTYPPTQTSRNCRSRACTSR